MKFFVTLICFIIIKLNSFAQIVTPKEMENDLVKVYSQIMPFYYGNHDSLEFYSSLFSEKIINYIDTTPLSLVYPFQTLIDKNYCDITTSGDSLFRIYSWDSWLGGTMHIFNNIYQYKSGDKVYSKTFKFREEDDNNSDDTVITKTLYLREDDDPSGFYSDIFTLKANNKTYYLAVINGIGSTKDASQSIKVFTIENDSLNDSVKLIKTKTELLNEINVHFDFFSVVDRPERPLKLIKYDLDKKIIYIPIVLEDGTVTDRFILYQFKGQYFEHILTQKK